MRLIDADALKSEFEWLKSVVNECSKDEVQETIQRIENVPTVDAAPVVHGEWERIEDDYLDLVNLKCSVCGEEWCFEDYDDCVPQNYHYCPNCGAKMDGERKTNEESKA